MQIGMSAIACSFIYLIVLAIAYFKKERVNQFETKLYSVILVLNIVGLFLEFICCITVNNIDVVPIQNEIVNRLYLMYFVTYITIFTMYVYYVSFNKETSEKQKFKISKNIMKYIFAIIYFISLLFVTILPLYYFSGPNSVYSYGPATDFITFLCAIYMVIDLYCMVKNFRNIKTKKNIPLFVLLFCFAITFIIRTLNPSIILINSSFALVTAIMYFTIENPDVTVIKQLTLARDTAEKANRAKSDFLSSMSHEIRTPLNAIVGFSEMMETETDIETCKENAKDIVMASRNLLEIVNGILDISKIEANKMEILNKEYSLLSELENLSKLMIPRIGEKPIELVTNFAPDIPDLMYGDIGKIKQIVTNLLTNAVKYTDSGRIDFKVKCVNDKNKCTLMFSISDTGRGIKPEKIDTLFTKFNRLEEDKNTTIEGTGLGLAITKSLVEMMDGKIVVQSEYGVGSNFTVYLAQRIVKMKTGLETTKLEETNYDFTGSKILIVDDNKLNLKVAEKMLKKYNISTTSVESGIECIERINNGEKYDLILMDDMMPKMRGTETLSKLKEINDFNIKTIVLTANAFTGIREKYIKDGFDDYLSKPIEKNELVKILLKYLKTNSIKEQQASMINNQTEKSYDNDYQNFSNKKILIVDDNKLNIKVASRVIKSYGFIIDEAYSGKDGIEKVSKNKYDLIFMDYMMPEMDGIETLYQLKKIPNFNTPVIALTADSVDGARNKFLRAGFNEYIAKPIDKEVMEEIVNKIIND